MRKFLFIAILLMLVFSSLTAAATQLTAEKSLPFNFTAETDTIVFEVEHPGNRFLAIEADFTGTATTSGAIQIIGENTIKAGPVTWANSFDRELFAHDGPISVLDDMLPAQGTWNVTLKPTSLPVSGQLKIIDLGPVDKIEYSEKTGTIHIKKPGVNEIVAVGKVEHPDFPGADNTFSGSVTADGDIMIPLPVGYYSLKHAAPMLNSVQAHMVPVHAGKITVIENWPQTPPEENESAKDNSPDKATEKAEQIEKELKIRSIKLLENDQVSVRFATPHWQGIVDKIELETHEGGMKAEVVSAGPVDSPLDLTILLDSSGSMKKDMKLALSSVETFISLLPESCNVTLVDFDTKTKEITAKDRTALIKALKNVKADGATCLNDSVMLGLQKSDSRGRPAVLLFTDGFDANHNDTGPGSKTTPEEMFAAVKAAEVPVFTIGFGAKPDDATLKRLATLSGGFYCKADKDNIGKVFAQVASILGREHQMVYRRPGVSGNSDAPVISIVLDVSGSMNFSPEDEGCDYRLEKAKAILRNLITKLPDDAIAQITTYSYGQDVAQVFTGNKTQLLASLAPVSAGGGTETLATLKVAFKMLNAIPTDRKYMLFITDAGLDLAENPVEYESVLGSIKDAGIQMTWIGMVDAGKKEPFDQAAKLCNGQAVVSTDFAAVQEAIDKLGKSIITASGTSDGRIPVKLTFSRRENNGRMLVMSAAEKFKMPAPPVTSKASVNGISISFVDMPQTLQRYSLELSQTLYGNSTTRNETIITQRLPINAVSSNKAMQLTVVEMLMMSNFRGVNLQCAAMKLQFKNIMPEQDVAVMSSSDLHPANFVGNAAKPLKTIKAIPPYLIPNLRSHFFAQFNDKYGLRVSDLSWIVENPLITPEDESLLLKPGETVEGYLVFELPVTETLKKASLSFYDNCYGNLQVPIVGIIDAASDTAPISRLPQSIEGNISEKVKISMNGFSDQKLPEPYSHLLMRIFDLQITSQEQDFLDLNPAERLSLLLPTRSGNLIVTPSPRTIDLPMGWHKPVLFLPGSNNYLKQAYVIPESLGKMVKGTLRLDIAGNELMLGAGDKQIKADAPIVTADGDKIKLAINAYKIEQNLVYIDLTLTDEKDGSGTTIADADICHLELGGEVLQSTSDKTEYMFQARDSNDVADGQQRRLMMTINFPGEPESGSLLLKSKVFKLELPLKNGGERTFDEYMLTRSDYYHPQNSTIEDIKNLVEKVHAERIASGWKKQGSTNIDNKTTTSETSVKTADTQTGNEEKLLAPPDFKGATASLMQKMMKMSEAEFITFMQSLRCIPCEKTHESCVYDPEAVLMQNWGTQGDLVELARLYYKSTGALVSESHKLAVLSERGKQELEKLTGWKTELEHIPILEAGNRQLVFPFVKDIGELGDIVAEVLDDDEGYTTDSDISINIYLKVRPKNSGTAAQMGSMGDALGGGSEDNGVTTIPVFNAYSLKHGSCSRSPIDVFYYSPDQGKTLYAAAEGAEGRIENHAQPVSLTENEVIEENIEIQFEDGTLYFSRPVANGVSIVDTFRTFALGMPDLSASAAMLLADEFSSRKTVEAPGTRSTAKWYARSRIYQFLAMHSAAEAEAAKITGVKVGRPGKQLRAIILTMSQEKDRMRAALDLRQINPQVQGEEKAVKAFNFFMGTTNAMLEEHVMGGGGLLSRWQGSTRQKLVVAGPEDMSTLIEGLDPEIVSEQARQLLQQAADNGLGVIFPLEAPVIDNKAMASWFTFNPETYQMISVLDDGSHGSMVEQPITEIIQDAAKYGVGFLVGVNASVWAVTAFTLKYDDMRLVVKAAKELCLGIAEQLKNIGKPLPDLLPKIPTSYTAHELEASAGPVSVKVGFGEVTPTSFKLMTKPSISFNFSYQSGFEDAVKAYFHD